MSSRHIYRFKVPKGGKTPSLTSQGRSAMLRGSSVARGGPKGRLSPICQFCSEKGVSLKFGLVYTVFQELELVMSRLKEVRTPPSILCIFDIGSGLTAVSVTPASEY